MKIVIDIPEGAYKELNDATFPVQEAYRLVDWIKSGQPLPKGHGRLIDADEYSREMREQQNRVAEYRDDIARDGGNDTEQYHRADASLLVYIDARLILDKIPTIIEAEQEGQSMNREIAKKKTATMKEIEALFEGAKALEQEEQTIAEESEEEKTERLEKTLKPCPFCGGQAHIMRMGYPHYIYCENCGAKIHGGKIGDGAEEASVKAWNRRRLPATKIFQPSAEDIFRTATNSKELDDYIRGLFEEVWEAHQKREEKKQ